MLHRIILLMAVLLAFQGCESQKPVTIEEAKASFAAGDFVRAKQQFTQLASRFRDNPAYSLLKARALLELGDGWGAESAIKEAMDRGADKDQSAILMAEAKIYQDQYRQAEDILKTIPDKYKAQILRLKGTIALSGDDPNAAWEAFNEAAQLAPQDGRVLLGLSRSYLRRGQFDLAVESAVQASKTKPPRIAALLLAGEVEWRRHDYEKAIEYYDQVLKRKSNNVQALASKADMLQLLGRDDESMVVIGQLEAISPNHVMINMTKGKNAMHDGKKKEAKDFFQRTGKAYEYDDEALVFMAEIAMDDNNVWMAIENMEKAIELRPDKDENYIILAQYLYQDKRYKEAIAILDDLRGEPFDPPPELLAMPDFTPPPPPQDSPEAAKLRAKILADMSSQKQ